MTMIYNIYIGYCLTGSAMYTSVPKKFLSLSEKYDFRKRVRFRSRLQDFQK